jgi:hypothetical protein
MDEKGTLIGRLQRECILVPQEEKIAFITQDRSREWVSSLEYICVDGSAINTFIILKGIHFKMNVFDHATPGIIIATSEKGWTSKDLALTWLRHYFEP